MKSTFRLALLILVVAAAIPQMLAYGPNAAPQGSAQTTAKPPAPKSTTPPAAAKSTAPAAQKTKAKPASSPAAAPSVALDPALVAQGKARYEAYKCKDCHGEHGEGTADGPDLIGTQRDAAGIAKFLNKPSSDADAKGMPDIPPDSPDLKPLVAYVLSLKGSKAK